MSMYRKKGCFHINAAATHQLMTSEPGIIGSIVLYSADAAGVSLELYDATSGTAAADCIFKGAVDPVNTAGSDVISRSYPVKIPFDNLRAKQVGTGECFIYFG